MTIIIKDLYYIIYNHTNLISEKFIKYLPKITSLGNIIKKTNFKNHINTLRTRWEGIISILFGVAVLGIISDVWLLIKIFI